MRGLALLGAWTCGHGRRAECPSVRGIGYARAYCTHLGQPGCRTCAAVSAPGADTAFSWPLAQRLMRETGPAR